MSEEKRFPETLPMWGEKKNSVQDVRRFLDALGAPDRDLNIIHVAGTNGKGSVCAYLTQALMDAGKKTGTFLSPHLVSIRERIRINNVPVDEALFSETAERVREQSVPLMLALSERYIRSCGSGACRLHGGGFAGVIMAVLPRAERKRFFNYIAAYAGKENVYVMGIRGAGAVELSV